jgi:adenylate cyclase
MTAPRASKSAASPARPGRAGFFESVWERIKAHKVVQWSLAYLAVAYTLLHGAEMLTNSLSWPHAWLRVFALLLILGLPLVVTRAWYHGTYARQRFNATEVMIVALLLAAGGTLVWRDTTTRHAAHAAEPAGEEGAAPSAAAAPAASIAVLPFADLSPEGNQGYFSDGVAEEILNVLAHVSGLEVASRTSSFQFRNTRLGVPDIARQLGVRNILEGSVRKAGDTVRVTAQLVDAASDKHLWSQTFDRPLTTANLFSIQDEIASDIVRELTRTIGPAAAGVGKPAQEQAGTESVDVYDLYLKGHALFLVRSPANLGEAARLLRLAVAGDPKFARAWESLAAVLAISPFWGLKEEPDYEQAALEAADRALALDPGLSLAHAVRGRVQVNRLAQGGAGSWEQSLTDLDEAVARDAQNATAYLWRGGDYSLLGYRDRARADYLRCLALDPAYEVCRRVLAADELLEGHIEPALRLYEVGLARGYVNLDAYFAPAIAARSDRVGTIGALLQQYRSAPPLLQALFRALTDPTFTAADRQEALALVEAVRDDHSASIAALWILKDYERIVGISTDFPVYWLPGDAAWLKSAARKRMIERWRLPEYWRAHGFPPQCKAVGAADFSCP